jgi:hypothetical protein
MAQNRNRGRRQQRSSTPQKTNNFMEDFLENEGTEHPVK